MVARVEDYEEELSAIADAAKRIPHPPRSVAEYLGLVQMMLSLLMRNPDNFCVAETAMTAVGGVCVRGLRLLRELQE